VGEGCCIFENSTLLPGVNIGNNTIIGAGSVVTKDIPAGVIAYGNPCKVVRNND
jgi:acetyltransferase-like isoleucine patch superfamily enzyme